MSKSDKDLESRTVANSSLQQSSFVFFPEEEKIRRQLLQNPKQTLQAAEEALLKQAKKIADWKLCLAECFKIAVAATEKLAPEAKSFAENLPQSVFGVGNGTEFLLPLDRLFECVRTTEAVLDGVILKLDPFLLPDLFDPSRFAFLESVLPQTKIATRAEEIGAKGKMICAAAKDFSARIEVFLSTVIQPFVMQAAKAANVDHDGNNMRFGTLCALCGELQSAAGVFTIEWNEQAQKIGAI
ncbi:MAG: hypothetical protein E7680_05985 [Ruminococcaceae bacterium]|nr:hypothetical protein [Oscillospiraceae bacterium]